MTPGVFCWSNQRSSAGFDWDGGEGVEEKGRSPGQVKAELVKERLKLPSRSPRTPQVQKLVILPVCPPRASQNHLHLHISNLSPDLSMRFRPGDLHLQSVCCTLTSPTSSGLSGMGRNTLAFTVEDFCTLFSADEDRHTGPGGQTPVSAQLSVRFSANTIIPATPSSPALPPACSPSSGLCICQSSCLGLFSLLISTL